MRTTYCRRCKTTTEGHCGFCPECGNGWGTLLEHNTTNNEGKAMPITTDEDARADVKLMRKYITGLRNTSLERAAQRLCLYVDERLPKKTKWVRALSIGDFNCGRIDERNIVERIRVAIDNHEGCIVINSAHEVPDDD